MALEWDRAVRLAGMKDLELLADFFLLAPRSSGNSRRASSAHSREAPGNASSKATEASNSSETPGSNSALATNSSKTSSPDRYRKFDKKHFKARLADGWNILLLEDDDGLAGVAMMQISVSQATLGPVIALNRHNSQRAHLKRLISVAELLCQAKGCKKICFTRSNPNKTQIDPVGQTIAMELGYQTSNKADEAFASKSL